MRKISLEEREMLIVANNFNSLGEAAELLGMTVEEAGDFIFGFDF